MTGEPGLPFVAPFGSWRSSIAPEAVVSGFVRLAEIVRSAQAELAFYGGVFGLTPADDLPPLPWRAVAS